MVANESSVLNENTTRVTFSHSLLQAYDLTRRNWGENSVGGRTGRLRRQRTTGMKRGRRLAGTAIDWVIVSFKTQINNTRRFSHKKQATKPTRVSGNCSSRCRGLTQWDSLHRSIRWGRAARAKQWPSACQPMHWSRFGLRRSLRYCGYLQIRPWGEAAGGWRWAAPIWQRNRCREQEIKKFQKKQHFWAGIWIKIR